MPFHSVGGTAEAGGERARSGTLPFTPGEPSIFAKVSTTHGDRAMADDVLKVLTGK